MNYFERPNITRAFAKAERVLGSQPFKLDDGRTLTGTINRVRRGETMLENGQKIQADAVVVATRPQFTPAGAEEKLPLSKVTIITFSGTNWRAEYVAEDECHVTLYCCRTSNAPQGS